MRVHIYPLKQEFDLSLVLFLTEHFQIKYMVDLFETKIVQSTKYVNDKIKKRTHPRGD